MAAIIRLHDTQRPFERGPEVSGHTDILQRLFKSAEMQGAQHHEE
jgi:hypothetical protein